MPKIKTTLSLVGNYMCKNPPVIIFNITEQNNQKQTVKKYLFNTPPDIQRNLQSQFVRIYGSETIMFTSFSHQVLGGLVNLILALHDHQKKRRVLKLKFYGTQKHWDYFQTAKFHLGQKVYGLSYASWLIPEFHRLGIIDEALYQQIFRSDKFSSFLWRINWKIQNEPKQKINDSRQYLKGKNEYYEDEYMIINPFFEDNPSIDPKTYRSLKSKTRSQTIVDKDLKEEYSNSSTHFLCISKNQQGISSTKQNNDSGQNNVQTASLIITYKSIEQMSRVLERRDKVQTMNRDLGLLEFIQMNLKGDQSDQSKPRIHLQNVVHIISSPELVHSQQFYQLFNTIDNLCYPSSTPATHLFYGYGIKSSTTNIHHLLNSYYKGIRFYSICSKLFKFIPNITQNHLSYWSKIFDKDFANVCATLEEMGIKQNGSFMEVYKPMHSVNVYESASEQSGTKQQSVTKDNFYTISAQFLADLKYPLFSTATQYRLTQQFRTLYEKKASFQKYNPSKAKTSRGVLISRIKQIKQFDPKVIFLGTNSKTPSELRNVSGILLELPHDNTETLCILDCGAGTYEQFVYQYAPEELEKKLLSLKVIFMTHLHADHNLGIIDLIKKRIDLLKRKNLSVQQNKLFVILPFNTLSWFYGYCKSVQDLNEGCQILLTQTLTGQKINLKDDFFESKRCQINMDRLKLSPGKLFGSKNSQNQTNYQSTQYYQRYIKRFGSYEQYVKTLPQDETSVLRDIFSTYTYKQVIIKELFNNLLQKIKIKQFMPSKVFHCPFSYGIVIEHNNGIKISYSGDCRPTPQFLEQAKNSTLLIHEATFETNNQQKAIRRLHSTVHEAIQACITSKSDHVCLTHFTPAPFDRDIAESSHRALYKPEVYEVYKKKAIIACDHLSFNLSEVDDVVKASKIISHIGRNSITENNINPYTAKFLYIANMKEEQKNKDIDENKIE